MSNSTEQEPKIIRDLLDSDLSVRKKAFSKLQKHWKKEFREYLWMAVEQEDNEALQADYLRLAKKKLENDHGLRKMIRFVEKDQLSDKAMKAFIRAYCEYEDEKARIALVKSLKRERSKTHRFVCHLLQSDDFEKIYVQNQENDADELVKDILDPDIPLEIRKHIISVVFWMVLRERVFDIESLLNSILPLDRTLHYHVLLVFFRNDMESDWSSSFLPELSKMSLVWSSHWNWELESEPLVDDEYSIVNINNAKYKITEHLPTMFVIQSLDVDDKDVRRAAIGALNKEYIDLSYDWDDIGTNYFGSFNSDWSIIYNLDVTEHLIFLDEFTPDSLNIPLKPENFHSSGINLDIENDVYPTIYERFQGVEVDLEQIILLEIAYMPRNKLIEVSKSDPHLNNRVAALKLLQESEFWYNEAPIGPFSLWIDIIKSSLEIYLQEQSNWGIKSNLRKLVYLLIKVLEDNSDKFTNEFEEMLVSLINEDKEIQTNLDELEDVQVAKPLVIKLRKFLDDSSIEVPDDITLAPDDLLLDELLDDFHQYYQKVITVYRNANQSNKKINRETRRKIIDKIDQIIDGGLQFVDEEIRIQAFLEFGKRDIDVKLRTQCQLLAKKLELQLIPDIIRNLNLSGLTRLEQLLELDYTPLTDMIETEFEQLIHQKRSTTRQIKTLLEDDIEPLQILVNYGYSKLNEAIYDALLAIGQKSELTNSIKANLTKFVEVMGNHEQEKEEKIQELLQIVRSYE